MKRIIALLVVAVLCLGMLASCDVIDQVKDMIGIGGPEAPAVSIEEASSFLHELYKSKKETTLSDFDVVAKLQMQGVEFNVTWTSDNAKVTIEESSKAGHVKVNLPDTNTEEFTYTLTATITNAQGESAQRSYTFKMPAIDNGGVTSTPVEGVAYKLFLLQGGENRRYYALATTQNNENKFINTTLNPKDGVDFFVEKVDGGYKWYTMVGDVKTYVYAKVEKSEDANTGTVKYSKFIGFNTEEGSVFSYSETKGGVWIVTVDNYGYGVGTYGSYTTISLSDESYFTPEKVGTSQYVVQFMTSEYANTLEEDKLPESPSDAESILNQLYGLADGEQAVGSFTLTGKIIELDGYNNPTIVVEGFEDKPVYCYRLSVENQVGDVITVTATTMKNYGGTYEFMNCTLVSGAPEDPGTDTPVTPPEVDGEEIVFDFGENGTAGTHADGNDISESKEYTSGNYTLSLTGAYKAYDGGFDAAGNSILKLGTGSVVGTVTFVVPDEVTSVIIYAARYKSYADNNIIVVNGTEHTLTTNSDNGQYEAIVVDTTTNKTVTVASSSNAAKPRCVVNSIVWVIGEGSDTPVDPQPPVHEHNFVDGKCECGETDPNYTPDTPVEGEWKVTTELKTGDHIIIGAPAYGKLLSMVKVATYYNKGVNYSETDFSNVTDDEIFEVTVNDDGSIELVSLTGKVVAIGGYSSLDVEGANKTWSIEAKAGADGIFYLKNNGTGKYLEWYASKDNWSSYAGTLSDLFELSFYVKSTGSDTPVEPPHEHNFVDGKCECGETDPNYVPPHEHNFVEGKCECGEIDPNYTPEVSKGGSADFNTIVTSNANGDSSYTKSYTTTDGWVIANSAIQCGGASNVNPQFTVIGPDNTHKAVCMNGKTSALGSITSPTLTGGISKLTINYTKMFTDTKLSVTVTITDLATGTEYTHDISVELPKDEKYVVYTDEWVLDTAITGDFTIEIVNNCPSGSTSNKDRMTILSIDWQ